MGPLPTMAMVGLDMMSPLKSGRKGFGSCLGGGNGFVGEAAVREQDRRDDAHGVGGRQGNEDGCED